MKTIAAIMFAAALALPPVAALAETDERPASTTVSFADLDLNEPMGREALSRRIDAAVRRVCPRVNGRADLSWSAQIDACRATARADAEKQLATIYGGAVLAQNAVRVRASLN